MLKKMLILSLNFVLVWLAVSVVQAQEKDAWRFLSLSATHVDQFLKAHPTYDGRGTVIFVVDTGVDMGIPGLQKTSTGETKVIDARDFSGEGDVSIYKAKLDPKYGLYDPDRQVFLRGYDSLPLEPKDNQFYIGVLNESRFKNTSVKDINDNGTTDDKFGVLTFEVQTDTGSFWVAFVDADLDGEVNDEKPLRDYRIDYDTFYFPRLNPDKQARTMTFALNIFPREKVSFLFADNAHGTHVAGIAAGFQIDGQSGFNGVAPGAKVISLKIGNGARGSLSMTESMKNAFEFADNYSREHDTPCVLNMSFGIGSEYDGRAEIDKLTDKILQKNPWLAMCFSAGNEGPGISTIGSPAAAKWDFASGALMAKDVAKDAYGAILPGDRILHFSSRGGVINKPDVVTPGAAVSTVPRWAGGNRFWGTSMASPYSAGVMSVLLSGIRQSQPRQKVKFSVLKRAVRNSARQLAEYSLLDQGSGLVDVPPAYELLGKYLRSDAFGPAMGFTISSFSPLAPEAEGRTAYWRSSYYPENQEQHFKVNAEFYNDVTADQKMDYFQAFNLKSDADWMKPVQSSVFIRGESSADVSVEYLPEKIKAPGLYTGKIVATFKGKSDARENTAFELWNTIIVPYEFDSGNKYRMEFRNQTVEPLLVKRYFLDVPAGATTLDLKARIPEGKFAFANVEVFLPQGRTYRYLPPLESDKNNYETGVNIPANDLVPGVWEVDVWGNVSAGKTSAFDLSGVFFGFEARPDAISELTTEPGTNPTAELKITNLFNLPFEGTASGSVNGFSKKSEQHLQPDKTFSYSFHLDPSLQAVTFKAAMTPKAYAQFTDIGISIYDASGKEVAGSAFNYRDAEVSYQVPADLKRSEEYILKITPGSTYAGSQPVDFQLEEIYTTRDKINIYAEFAGEKLFTLIPDNTAEMKVLFDKILPTPPAGYQNSGELIFKEKGTGRTGLVVPVRIPGTK